MEGTVDPLLSCEIKPRLENLREFHSHCDLALYQEHGHVPYPQVHRPVNVVFTAKHRASLRYCPHPTISGPQPTGARLVPRIEAQV